MTQAGQLSEREKEVVRLLLQGKSNKQIALVLGISDRTVEFHLTSVYSKFHVRSRIELILKLGNPTGGSVADLLGDSTVEKRRENAENRTSPNIQMGWVASCRNTISIICQEPEMKKRWLFYVLAGLIFGTGYWHYLGLTARFFNEMSPTENTMGQGMLFIFALLAYFSVWLFPAILPAVHELRHSTSLRMSILAVITVWVSAVLGYYMNYIIMLGFVGLPNMEYLVIFGKRTPTFWQDWADMFPKLILLKLLKWAVVAVLTGGITGLVTSSVYSSLSRNHYQPSRV